MKWEEERTGERTDDRMHKYNGKATKKEDEIK
jgi:hypothetical protein